MSRFDEEPERETHVECRHEIERLTNEATAWGVTVDNLTASLEDKRLENGTLDHYIEHQTGVIKAIEAERNALALEIDQWRVDFHELRLDCDALKVENSALLAANRDCINHFNQIKEDYDSVIAEREKLLELAIQAKRHQDNLTAERNSLKEVVALQTENFAELSEQHDALHGYFNGLVTERDALKEKLAALEAQKGTELRASFNFDDREKITITAYGTTRDMQLLEARLTRGILADQKLTALEAQPAETYQYQSRNGSWCHFINQQHYIDTKEDGSWPIRALFLAAGAAPVQQEPTKTWTRIDRDFSFDIGTNRHTPFVRVYFPTAAPNDVNGFDLRDEFAEWLSASPAAKVTPAQPRLTVRLTSFPESNGKRNWTALLVRADKWDGLIGNCGGISLARGELWNRVAWEAECAKFLIGERDTEPFILDYGDDISTPKEWAGEVNIQRLNRRKAAPQPKDAQ